MARLARCLSIWSGFLSSTGSQSLQIPSPSLSWAGDSALNVRLHTGQISSLIIVSYQSSFSRALAGSVPPDIGCLVFAALPVPDRCGWILLGEYLLTALRSGGCRSSLWLFTTRSRNRERRSPAVGAAWMKRPLASLAKGRTALLRT